MPSTTLPCSQPLHGYAEPGDPHALRDAFASQVAETALALLDPDRIEAIGEDMGIVLQHRTHHAGLHLRLCAAARPSIRRSPGGGAHTLRCAQKRSHRRMGRRSPAPSTGHPPLQAQICNPTSATPAERPTDL
ncbi:hypothetical protein predicted by Glimmer/Critica [Sorangium cellulosum So ce56]|uniref:Uncharacterized protein n=1 Tax=Sorangium cellulosum (strain So ce56) TaxID=448385 RepID=A9FBC3_SORC5|nr:hypothetical protein predicted by Glimmer/Critica [Sorangium cellulosum So ce56]